MVERPASQTDTLDVTQDKWKRRVAALRDSLEVTRRRVPSPDILAGIFRHRIGHFPPADWMPSAIAREQRFAHTNEAYRQPIGPTEDALVQADGITFCLPQEFARVKIPWQAILQIREVTTGGVMLDIGANVGQTSVPRVLIGDVQAVYAAEADLANYARLRQIVERNRLRGFYLPDLIAISDHDGMLRFHQASHFKSHAPAADGDEGVIEVRCLTVDSWLTAIGVDPAAVYFVKTDTNGSELAVLAGARGLLGLKQAVWQVEIAPASIAHMGSTLGALCDALVPHFTSWLDLNRRLTGRRVRPIAELHDGLAYVETMERKGKGPMTDILCFNV